LVVSVVVELGLVLTLGSVVLVECPLVGKGEVALEDVGEIEAEPGWD
jgi:hypothetical protein